MKAIKLRVTLLLQPSDVRRVDQKDLAERLSSVAREYLRFKCLFNRDVIVELDETPYREDDPSKIPEWPAPKREDSKLKSRRCDCHEQKGDCWCPPDPKPLMPAPWKGGTDK